jgi:hypothetical protein
MEQLWLEILKIVGSGAAGGGIAKLLHLRLKRRELNNKISKEEYETFDEILDGFMQRNSRLATDIADIREKNAVLENHNRRLEVK